MPGLADFERLIESLVERSMIAPLRGKLQPIELAKRLERAMRDHALLGVDAQIAPNHFRVRLNPDDAQNLASARGLIEGELARHVAQSGSAQGYVFLAPPTVEIVPIETVRKGAIQIEAEIREPKAAASAAQSGAPAAPRPAPAPTPAAPRPEAPGAWVLDFGSWRAPLPDHPVKLGRGLDCDVVVPSPRVSRQHAELAPTRDGVQVRDLGSTNGTTIDGQRVAGAVVAQPGARIAFGGVEARLAPNDGTPAASART